MMKLRLFALAAVVLTMADAAGVARRMEEDVVYQPLDDTTLAQSGMEGASMSILDTAQAAGLNMFIAALSAAKLTDLFKTKGPLGPFTVFAPSDAAFEALGDDVKAMLFADPEGALTDLLLRHVVVRKTMSLADVEAVATPDVHAPGATVGHTLGTSPAKGIKRYVKSVGGDLNVMVVGADGPGRLEIGGWRAYKGANVAQADVACTNGIVHIIDKVLLAPPSKTASSGTTDRSAFVAAGALAGVGSGLIFLVGAHAYVQRRRAAQYTH